MTPVQQALYSTVGVEAWSGPDFQGYGTGYFWRVEQKIDGSAGHTVLLMTNKHVIEGADTLKFICRTCLPTDPQTPRGLKQLQVDLTSDGLFPHPCENVDLVGVAVGAVLSEAEEAGTPLFTKTIGRGLMAAEDEWARFDAVEDILMLGCPNGIYDVVNATPIVRRGITASPLTNDYCGRPEFVIDIATFGGSSGSPVLLRRPLLGLVDRYVFVGTFYGGPVYTDEVSNWMHLGFVIKAHLTLDIDNMCRAVVDRTSGHSTG